MASWTARGVVCASALVPILAFVAAPVDAGPRPVTAEPAVGVIGSDLNDASGPLDVVLRLSRPSLAEAVAPNATRLGTLPDGAAQQAIVHAAEQQQHDVLSAAHHFGATELGAISRSLNAVIVEADAASLPDLAAIPGVMSVTRVPSYDVTWPRDTPVASGSLDQAARYLDLDRAYDRGLDGTGIRAAVIDSGIDFTHVDLGGPGTAAAYTECYGTPPGPGVPEAGQPRNAAPTGTCATLFGPGAPKVIGGFDFVGEAWPNGAVAPDPNPIDFEGHGTHVADILSGRSADGTHKGLAPGLQLYAYKACSAVTTGCNGTAVLEAIDRALDPNQDGNMSDAVDLINMSLGSFYGQPESADTLAVSNAVRAGVVVAVAAGNDGDRPWIVGQPSIAAGRPRRGRDGTAGRLAAADRGAQPDDRRADRQHHQVRRAPGLGAGPDRGPHGHADRPGGPRRAVGLPRQPGLRPQQLHRLRPVRAPHRADRPGHVRRVGEGHQRRGRRSHRRRVGQRPSGRPAGAQRRPRHTDHPGRVRRPGQGQPAEGRGDGRPRRGPDRPGPAHLADELDGDLVVAGPVADRRRREARPRRTGGVDVGGGRHRHRRAAVQRHVGRHPGGGRRRRHLAPGPPR